MRSALSAEVWLTTGGASMGYGKFQLLPVRATQQIWMPSPCCPAQPPLGWRRLHRYYRHRDLQAACRSHSLRAPVAPQDRDVAAPHCGSHILHLRWHQTGQIKTGGTLGRDRRPSSWPLSYWQSAAILPDTAENRANRAHAPLAARIDI